MSKALAPGAVRKAKEAPKTAPIACRRPIVDAPESLLPVVGIPYPWADNAEAARTMKVAEVFMSVAIVYILSTQKSAIVWVC